MPVLWPLPNLTFNEQRVVCTQAGYGHSQLLLSVGFPARSYAQAARPGAQAALEGGTSMNHCQALVNCCLVMRPKLAGAAEQGGARC